MSTRDQTLAEVIRIIPESCYEHPTWKGLAYLARDLAVYAAVLVALAATDSWWLLVPLWALSALVVSGLFIIGHDAAHGALFESKRLCYGVGQLAMLPSLHVYEAWVLGHNRLHHGHTVREQMDFVWHPLSPEQYAALSPLGKLRHRVEWSLLGSGLYYLRDVWWNKMMRLEPPAKLASAIHRDWWIVVCLAAAATLGLLSLGWASYGSVGGAIWMWRLDRVRPPHRPADPVAPAPGVEQVQGPDGGDDDPARAARARLLLPQHLLARAPPRRHADPLLRAARGLAVNPGALPRRGRRATVALPRLSRGGSELQAVRLRERRLAHLRAGPRAARPRGDVRLATLV
jgi:hypothetical protein